jgi:hypothetical protein
MQWTIAEEDLLENLVDEAQIRHRLHKRCYEHYKRRSQRWTLPVIILSVISGSGNFISQSFPDIEKEMIISIGGISVLVSIISSISQYLGLSKLSEGNRIAMLSWGKFASMIRFEIGLHKKDRETAKDFYKQVVNEYQRLQEISPNIPEEVVTSYRRELGELPENFKIPLWFNGVRHIEAFQSPSESSQLQEPDDAQTPPPEEQQPPSENSLHSV